MKNKLISVIATIIICISIFIGGTYALFTSKSETSIAVTSGKIELTAKVNEESIQTSSSLSNYIGTNTFETGGTAIYDSSFSTFTLTNMVPGDRVDFSIDIVNNSNISIIYRVNMLISGELSSVLKTSVTIDNQNYDISNKSSTNWQEVVVGQTTGINDQSVKDDIKAYISFPTTDDDNVYQSLSGTIIISVEALQANAGFVTNNGVSYTTFQEAIDDAKTGDVLTLNCNYSFTKSDIAYSLGTSKYAHLYIPADKNITLDLNGYVLENANDLSDVNRYDVIVNYGNLKITNGKIISNNDKYATSSKAGGFGVLSYGDLTLENVTIDGNNVRSYAVYIEGKNKKLIVNNSNISGRGGIAVCGGAEATINSGNIYLDVETTNPRDNAIYVDNSNVIINGGNIDATLNDVNSDGKGGNALLTQGICKVIVNGGIFDAAESTLHTYTNGVIEVYGGTFKQIVKLHQDKQGSITLYGGNYKYEPEAKFIADGYEIVNENDFYVVQLIN